MHPVNKLISLKYWFPITIILFAGCKTKITVQGVYRPNNEIGPDRSSLVIKRDYTFSFSNFSDIMGAKTANGKWQVKNNLLLLEKDSLPKLDTFIKVIEKPGRIDSKTIIRVVDATDNKPIVGANFQLNDERTHYFVDTTGIVNIDSTFFLQSILFSYGSIQRKWNISNHNAKDVTLIVNFDNAPLVGELIVPKKWMIKKNRLIPLNDSGFLKPAENAFIKKSDAN